MSRPTAKVSLKSLKEDDQNLVRKARRSPVDLEYSPGQGTTNVSRSDCPFADDLKCLDTFSNIFTRDFCNIRGLTSYFQSVESHHICNKPHFLFLTETQLSATTDSSPFSVPSYFLYPFFECKASCCAFVRNDIICSRAHNLQNFLLSC